MVYHWDLNLECAVTSAVLLFFIKKCDHKIRSKIPSDVTITESSIRRRSVVSFYVNEDVWRFLPLAIKGKNWISIADAYLASKLK